MDNKAQQTLTPQKFAVRSPDSNNEIIRPTTFQPAGGAKRKKLISINPISIALAAMLVICGLIAAFLLTARAILINTDPLGTSLALSGGLNVKFGEHYLAYPGQFTLKATSPGYYPLEETLDVSEEQQQTFHFQLQKLPGNLIVSTTPQTHAEIYIDNQLVGAAEQTLKNLSPGKHLLSVKAERFRPYEEDIEIEGKDLTQQLSVALDPAWATITLTSTPAGAQLFVENDNLGSTPINAEVLEGERTLMLKLPGYKAWKQTLSITAGEDQTLPGVTLEKADGLVMLRSNPEGAAVTISGEYRGQTPIELALTPGKEYTLTLYKDGFEAANRKLRVESGQDREMSIKLEALLGKISIQSQPKDALVYIDGRLMGRASQTFSLPAHKHKVTVKKDGYMDYSTEVLPRPGLAQVVNVRLTTQEQAKWEAIKPQITSPAGQKLKLFRPQVTFTMGASRREQGRRSNEVLRPIKLTRPFYLGISEVTNAEFRRFSKFHSSGHVKGNSLNNNNNPVVNISWQQAAAYCNWLSEQEKLTPYYQVKDGVITGFNPQSPGYRLPLETEWAWAARYVNGNMLKYPWEGNDLPPSKNSGNFADRSGAALLGNIIVNYNDGFAVTAPTGSFPPNDKGLYDLGGNVAEWISDFYGISTGLSLKTDVNPIGPAEGDYHVIRGSSWAHGTVTDLRLSFRDYGNDARNDVGFRIARFVE